jgi:hypothetical protein
MARCLSTSKAGAFALVTSDESRDSARSEEINFKQIDILLFGFQKSLPLFLSEIESADSVFVR